MTTAQITYNPGILGDEALARSFVVRQESLELILETLKENAASPAANRHLLMIGPRGIGKTMLVRRAAAAIRSNPEYSSQWYPLVFGEESYPVGTPGEFWLEALFHLADQTADSEIQKTLEELRDEPSDSRLRSSALARLLDFADHEGKRILLVVENLNTLIGEQMDSDSAWDLRHTLMNEPRLMLLGTATNRFDEIENIGHAWFEMFSVHRLQPLSLEECGELWRSITGSPLDRSPLKAVRILTGGNPRLITILAGFAAHHSFRQLMEQLVHLIDDHTEYFKGHLDSLAVKERRVFVALLETWDPVSAADLARHTRLNVNEVSALLGRLTSRGAVEVAKQKGRRKLYQASERLYNIYYLMRRRGHPEGRVQAAVRFMIGFYGRKEIIIRLADLAREACELPESHRIDHYHAYGAVLRKMQEIAPLVVECTPPEFFQSEEGKLARDAGISGLIKEAESLIDKRKFADAEILSRRALQLDENNILVRFQLVRILLSVQKFSEAEQILRPTFEFMNDGKLWTLLGLVLALQHRWQEATATLLKATELEPDSADSWSELGRVHYQLKQFTEAEAAARRAIQLEPNNADHYNNLANALRQLERHAEAETAYRRAIELEPKLSEPWKGLGNLLLQIGPPEKAEAVWAEALKLHGEDLALYAVNLLELRLARGIEHAVILREAEEWISRLNRNPETLATFAVFVVCWGLTEGFSLAESWAQETFSQKQDADYSSAALTVVLAGLEKWQDAIGVSKAMLDVAGQKESARQVSTEFLIQAAAAGWAKEALIAVQKSNGASALEPLVIGLQIYLGETPTVAKEILEIGQDVADRIRRYKAQATTGGQSESPKAAD